MILSPEDKHAISLLLESRGWELVRERAFARIKSVRDAALDETDETKFLTRYRECHAAQNALYEFHEDLARLME